MAHTHRRSPPGAEPLFVDIDLDLDVDLDVDIDVDIDMLMLCFFLLSLCFRLLTLCFFSVMFGLFRSPSFPEYCPLALVGFWIHNVSSVRIPVNMGRKIIF